MLRVVHLLKQSILLPSHQLNMSSSPFTYKVAVVLSGSGVYDGSEIHEAAATAAHLTRRNIEPVFYAPESAQSDVINHGKGEPMNESRNVLAESARIARGNIKPLNELTVKDVNGIVFPGGFGAAKNLSNFASDGPGCKLIPDITRIITEFHKHRLPQGFMCISPVLAARAIPGVKITLGNKDGASWPHAGAIDAAQAMGAEVQLMNVTDVCLDKQNLIVSTPAFMFDGRFHEIQDGIGNLIAQLEVLIKASKA